MGKASIRRRVTRKRKLNRKNKKTQRKGKKQTGGRRRPDGSVSSGNNGAMNEGGPDYLSEEEKEEAIGLIQDNKVDELDFLLGERTFPDDDTLIVAVQTPGVIMEMISKVIFRTYIHHDTQHILDNMHETFPFREQVIRELQMQKGRQEEAAALAQQEQKYANNGRVSTPPPHMNNEY
jgi:hypothetical protein